MTDSDPFEDSDLADAPMATSGDAPPEAWILFYVFIMLVVFIALTWGLSLVLA